MLTSYLRRISKRTKEFSNNLTPSTQNRKYSIFGIGYEINKNKTTGEITSLNLYDKRGTKHVIQAKDTPTKYRVKLNKCGELSIEEISSEFLNTKSGSNLAFDDFNQLYNTILDIATNGVKFSYK